ncbi:MAG: hypothetical protein LIP09_12265 [Bacteroidales bacterium]|nr:hypothetical protein [Bacteroidales bacterium]
METIEYKSLPQEAKDTLNQVITMLWEAIKDKSKSEDYSFEELAQYLNKECPEIIKFNGEKCGFVGMDSYCDWNIPYFAISVYEKEENHKFFIGYDVDYYGAPDEEYAQPLYLDIEDLLTSKGMTV